MVNMIGYARDTEDRFVLLKSSLRVVDYSERRVAK